MIESEWVDKFVFGSTKRNKWELDLGEKREGLIGRESRVRIKEEDESNKSKEHIESLVYEYIVKRKFFECQVLIIL